MNQNSPGEIREKHEEQSLQKISLQNNRTQFTNISQLMDTKTTQTLKIQIQKPLPIRSDIK